MAKYSRQRIQRLFKLGEDAETTTERGQALEDLVCYLFEKVPGIEIAERNKLNAFQTEEIDIALWNAKKAKGLYFLPHILLVECKNWSSPVGSQEVAYLASRLAVRGCDYGFLVACNGVTGHEQNLTAAHFELSTALAKGLRILVVTRTEIESLQDTDDLVHLVKKKLCQLTVSGTGLAEAN